MAELFSDIRIFPVVGNKTLKANGSAVIANTIAVKFRIVEGEKGLFVTLPSSKNLKSNEYFPEAWFPDKATKAKFQEAVLEAFNKNEAPKATATPGVKKTSKVLF